MHRVSDERQVLVRPGRAHVPERHQLRSLAPLSLAIAEAVRFLELARLLANPRYLTPDEVLPPDGEIPLPLVPGLR